MRFLGFLLFLSLAPVQVWAQGHSAFCGQADSTAASQECLKRHLDSVQRRLNKIYKKLGNDLEGEKLKELQKLQQTWLTYRDSECMWESEQSETPSLKRINELSCMARVTEDRVDLLTIASAENKQAGAQREYGSFPRWMNVVAKDYPKVFWNYGGRFSFDLNCDGEDEYAMTGMKTSLVKTDNEGPYFSKKIVVSIVQNPPTGRPTAHIFEFSIKNETDHEALCHDEISLNFKKNSEKKKSANVEGNQGAEPEICHAILKINHKGCAPKIISWTGKEFELEVEKEIKEIK